MLILQAKTKSWLLVTGSIDTFSLAFLPLAIH